jgi:hypothetical protein
MFVQTYRCSTEKDSFLCVHSHEQTDVMATTLLTFFIDNKGNHLTQLKVERRYYKKQKYP